MSLLLESIESRETPQEHPGTFDARFSRYRSLLVFIARHILGDEAWVEEAMRNCQRSYSGGQRKFNAEGAFRSWLLRVLINEALAVRMSRQEQIAELPPERKKLEATYSC